MEMQTLREQQNLLRAQRQAQELYRWKAQRDQGLNVPMPDWNKVAQGIGKAAKSVADFIILDDWRTLNDPNASALARTWAGISLASNFIPASAMARTGIKGFAMTRGMEKLLGKYQFKHVARVFDKSDETITALKQQFKLSNEQIRILKKNHLSLKPLKNMGTDITLNHNGHAIFRTHIKSNNYPLSYTIWESVVHQETGRLIYGHATFEQSGKLIHWKGKYPRILAKLGQFSETEYSRLWEQILSNTMK